MPVVRRELSDRDWKALGPGQLVGPDGRTYRRRTTRMGRRDVEALVGDGCPVVTYWPGGRLVWHDEDDAWPAWADARGAQESVTAGRWQSPDGAVAVVLVWSSDGVRA